MTETEIRAEIVKWLNNQPHCRVRVQQKHSKFRANQTAAGWPDISGYWGARALFIEVKKPGGTLSLEQHEFIKDADRLGHLAFFATSLSDVMRKLETGSDDRRSV
jgi:hypothetical protein